MSVGDRLRELWEAQERLKHRIHNFRIPIKSKPVYYAVSTLYFIIPIGLGTLVMKWTGSEKRAEEHVKEKQKMRQQRLEERLRELPQELSQEQTLISDDKLPNTITQTSSTN